MKKKLLTIFRFGVILLGVAYIITALDWSDHLVVPPDYPWPDGRSWSDGLALEVLSDDEKSLTLKAPGDEGAAPLTLPLDRLTGADTAPRLEAGITRTLAGTNLPLLLFAILLLVPVLPLESLRWWLLMRCRQIHAGYLRALSLTMVGEFCHLWVPGLAGGDFVKAYYAAKGAEKQGEVVVSIVASRLIGFLGLVMMGGLAGLTQLDDPKVKQTTMVVWLALALFALGTWMFFSPLWRRLLRVDKILGRFGSTSLVARVESAFNAYRAHKGTVARALLISLAIHLLILSAGAVAGIALGITKPMTTLMAVLSIAYVSAALPISYQGIGIMEGICIALVYDPYQATTNQIVSMVLLSRMIFILYALLGSVVMLKGDFQLMREKKPNLADGAEELVSQDHKTATEAPSS